jgi:hypothetical protein
MADAEHGDEDLRLADFADQPVDDDRNPIAGIIDEQPLAGCNGARPAPPPLMAQRQRPTSDN